MTNTLTIIGIPLMPIADLVVGGFCCDIGAKVYCLWAFIMAFITWALLFSNTVNDSKNI
jgi:hypothetical protein